MRRFSSRDTYTYNDRHELTSARTESKISGIYQELAGRNHAFTYDNQGNRVTHSATATPPPTPRTS